jgi:hypothetical protein
MALFFFRKVFVISTEGRKHTSISTKIGEFRHGITSVISPFGRNDKIVYIFLFSSYGFPQIFKAIPLILF